MTQTVERQNGGPGRASFVKRLLLGRPLATEEAGHQLLPRILALPVFSSDALSSVAYATEEIMLVLVLAGAGALRFVQPLSVGIAALLLIVVVSYRQTVRAYPSGGGAYIVSHENLGEMPGLIAAGALLTDYVLTVAVSVAAGVAAITSAAGGLVPYRVPIALVIVAFVTIMNLRGVKESGTLFAIPTYVFILVVYLMIGVGIGKCIGGCPHAESASLAIPAVHVGGISLFLLLRAFSSGSTALTGVEAISNGVPAFRRPQAHNAASTLAIMGAIAITMFLGISFLAHSFGVRQIPEETIRQLHPGMTTEQVCDRLTADPLVGHFCEQKTVVAQIAETAFGHGFLFYLVQIATALILILAANTSYQDFPRLASILARDRYMPRQFMNRGDRLVFSNGVVVLAVLSAVLIWIFNADVTRLIQLYVVGVFTSFTLSQTGMVRHWLKTRERGWKRSAVINGIGAFATGVVLIVVTLTKFKHGAYIVVIAIPIIVMGFKAINRHYRSVAEQLRAPTERLRVVIGTRAVVLVPRLDQSVMRAVGYARALRPIETRALYVGEDERADEIRSAWSQRGISTQLEVRPGDGDLVESVRRYVRDIEREGNEFVTVVLPETVRRRGFGHFLRQRRELMLKAALLFEPRVVVTNIPSAGEEGGVAPAIRNGGLVVPTRSVAIVLVSAVHNATLRALDYARAIGPTEVRAVTFSVDDGETRKVMEDWATSGTDLPLEVLDSPWRAVTRPLLKLVRQIRSTTPDAVVTVIVPEFVVSKWWHQFLHNQSALGIKAALLFEPEVVLTSVPFHLE